MVRLHGSVKERWEAVDESYLHHVKDQIIVMNKFCTCMLTLLTKFLQSLCIVHLNENNSFHGEKVYERNPGLDQMNR